MFNPSTDWAFATLKTFCLKNARESQPMWTGKSVAVQNTETAMVHSNQIIAPFRKFSRDFLLILNCF
ncbi:MAG: hypothetical protein EBS53_07840 [Bacteroidetes bacterium]|nr:hypothetical protein [Bacteroidota bacterium]